MQFAVFFMVGHAKPPKAGCLHARIAIIVPPPHDFVHVVQGSHGCTTASCGQANVLHERVSARYGHT